ncbi:EI24 domain-containing protein [Streptomyces mayteni]
MNGFAVGLRCLAQGQRWVFGRPRWLLFGLVPALIALVIYVGALVALALFAGDVAVWATPFADDWDDPWQPLVRVGFALLLVAAGLMLAVLTFTAVTLIIGDPFYQSLGEKVEETEGGAPAGPGRSLWQDIRVSISDSLRVLLWVLLFTVPLFVLGFVPVIGQTVIPAIGFAVSGFFLTVELTSAALDRRGLPLRERIRLLRRRLPAALGFGVPLILLFLIPLGAVLLMPGAVAGATLLSRALAPAPQRGAGNGALSPNGAAAT